MENTYIPPIGTHVHDVDVAIDERGASGMPGIVHLVQYDTGMPVIAAHLWLDSKPYAVPEDGTARLRMAKPDGNKIYDDAIGLSEDRATVYIKTTEQMTAAHGYADAILEISKEETHAGTGRIVIVIDANPVQDAEIKSSSEWGSIERAIKAAQDAAGQSAKSAASAKGSADTADKKLQSTTEQAEAADASARKAKSSEENAANNAARADAAANSAAGDAGRADAAADSAAGDAERAEAAAKLAQAIAQGQKGYYPTPADLKAAFPSGEDGDWAIVGSTDTIWIWDSDDGQWEDSGNKTDLSNYYTKEEVDDLLNELQTALGRQITEATTAITDAEIDAMVTEIFGA